MNNQIDLVCHQVNQRYSNRFGYSYNHNDNGLVKKNKLRNEMVIGVLSTSGRSRRGKTRLSEIFQVHKRNNNGTLKPLYNRMARPFAITQ